MLRQYASNMTIVEQDGNEVLFSYSTPVAGRNEDGVFRTSKWFSSTTTKHINKYFRKEFDIDGKKVRELPQEEINKLVKV